MLAPETTLPVDLVNRRAGQQLYAHVMGLDRATGRWFFLAPDAKTRVYPGSPTSVATPLPSTGIRLSVAGTARSITIPAMDSGRIYFSVGQALKFFVNPGGGIVLTITAGLRTQATVDNTGWRDLIVTHNGTVLRVLSPNLTTLPRLVGDVERLPRPLHQAGLAEYTTTDLRIDTQSAWGTLIGRVGA